MSTLHIISRRLDAQQIETLLRSRSEGDALLLTGDAVYLATQHGFLERIGECAALSVDVSARGLGALWPAGARLVDHAGFVSLCVAHDKSVSWA